MENMSNLLEIWSLKLQISACETEYFKSTLILWHWQGAQPLPKTKDNLHQNDVRNKLIKKTSLSTDSETRYMYIFISNCMLYLSRLLTIDCDTTFWNETNAHIKRQSQFQCMQLTQKVKHNQFSTCDICRHWSCYGIGMAPSMRPAFTRTNDDLSTWQRKQGNII